MDKCNPEATKNYEELRAELEAKYKPILDQHMTEEEIITYQREQAKLQLIEKEQDSKARSLDVGSAEKEVLDFLSRNYGLSPEVYALRDIHKSLAVLNRNIVMNNNLMKEQLEALQEIKNHILLNQ